MTGDSIMSRRKSKRAWLHPTRGTDDVEINRGKVCQAPRRNDAALDARRPRDVRGIGGKAKHGRPDVSKLSKPTSYYIGILRIGNYGEHGETIFLTRRTRVPRARDSGGLSAHLADNPVRHCGKRVLHAQLEAIPRNAAQKQVVWSHARKLGARQEHFAAFEDSGSRDDRREPHHFIRIFQRSAFCDDFRFHRVRRCIAIHPHEAEPAKIAA